MAASYRWNKNVKDNYWKDDTEYVYNGGKIKEEDATKITQVTIAADVPFFSENRFEGCRNLQSVDMSTAYSLEDIESRAFYACINLTTIVFPKTSTSTGTGTTTGEEDDVQITNTSAASNTTATADTSLSRGSKIDCIGTCAFYWCSSLERIDNIPDSVHTIWFSAFERCCKLKSIHLPDSIEEMYANVFENCTALEEVKFPRNLKCIPEFAFRSCTALTKIDFPPALEEIANGAFEGCTALADVTRSEEISTPLRVIGPRVFVNCGALKSFKVPSSSNLEEIGSFAFKNCKALTTVDFGMKNSKLKTIEKGTFQNCLSLTSVTLPQSVMEIGVDAFRGCTNLKVLEFPTSLRRIKSHAFSGCTGLATITIPAFLEEIEEYAFFECAALITQSGWNDDVFHYWLDVNRGGRRFLVEQQQSQRRQHHEAGMQSSEPSNGNEPNASNNSPNNTSVPRSRPPSLWPLIIHRVMYDISFPRTFIIYEESTPAHLPMSDKFRRINIVYFLLLHGNDSIFG